MPRCIDCDVDLSDAAPPRDHPSPVTNVVGPTTSIETDALSPLEQERLQMLLRGIDVRFEMSSGRVWFPEPRREEVEELLAEVTEVARVAEDRSSRRQGRADSRVRPDRRIVNPSGAPPDQAPDEAPDEFAGAWPRALARILDAWISSLVFSLSTLVFEPVPYATGTLLLVLFASFESWFGRTPGKAIVGIRVEDVHGRPPSLAAAMIRNSWQLAGAIPLVGLWLILVIQIGIGWVLHFDPMRRGPHDLVAHTFVVRSRKRRRTNSG